MNHVQQLRYSAPIPATPLVRPGLRLVWSTHHPVPWHAANTGQRMHQPPLCQPANLAGTWPQRGADTHAGQGPAIPGPVAFVTYYPGHTCGVRPPGEGEMPLSHAEVAHAVQHNLIG